MYAWLSKFTLFFYPSIFAVPTGQWEYIIDVVVNVSNVETFELSLSSLNATSLPIQLDNNIEISDISITTVCSSTGTGFQCRCEEHFTWPYSICLAYGACDSIPSAFCKCTNAIPADGQFCQPISALLAPVEYEVDVELNVTNIETVDYLRSLLDNGGFTLALGPTVNVTDIHITTVCYPNGTSFQCRCEDQYVWSYSNCLTYGACDEITDETCGCINSIPTNGQYCQPKKVLPVVYEYQISIEVNTTDVDQLRKALTIIPFPVQINSQITILDANITTVCSRDDTGFQCRCEDDYLWPCDKCATYGECDGSANNTCGCIKAIPRDGLYCQSIHHQTPPVLYEYIISVELNTTDVTLINQLRTTLRSISYPFSINNCIQISEANISTVCYPSSGGYQCLCEDQYRWPCDQCFLYGSCDNITDDTCGCINAIPPEGQYCQPAHQYSNQNNTVISIPAVNSTPVPTTAGTTATSTKATTASTTIPTNTSSTTFSTPSTISTAPTTPTVTAVPPSTVFKVEMSMELDKQFTATLNDSTSSEYKDLKSRIESVLKEQYKGITGFIGVSVNGFRKGSIITDFVVQTTQVKPTEVAEANKNIPDAMKSIATVIGSVTADYNSQTPITIPVLTYTGTSMTLTCGPPDINVGQINGSEWKFNGKKITESARIKVNTSGNVSILTVDNVILADIGLYECILIGKVINFNQKGDITNKIQQAPIVQLQSIVNVHCKGTEGQKQPLKCCVQSQFTVKWFSSSNILLETCITYNYVLGKCSEGQLIRFVCKVDDLKDYNKTTEMNIFTEGKIPKCDNSQYGTGRVGDESSIGCGVGQDGSRTAVCQQTGWTLLQDTCIVIAINNLLIASTNLNNEGIPDFVGNLNSTVQKEKDKIATSSATISAIVDILNNIADVSTGDVTAPVMENILETVDVIIGSESRQSWTFLNANRTSNASSALLSSMESLSDRLVGEIAFETPRILLNRTTTFNNSFTANLNIFIKVPNINSNVFFTTITFSTLDNVMPARNSSFDAIRFNTTSNYTVTDNAINAAVVLVKTNVTVQNVTLSFNKLNSSLLLNPQCVFWNFTLLNNLGAWDDEGCTFVSDTDNIVTCSCNHLTSFSILMATDIPPELREALDIITYFGVGISMASLVMCLIIEGYVWKDVTRNSTSFMRHVSIINTALSLLIADICFIIGASIAKNPLENPGGDYNVPVGPCSLLLFYRTVMVFSHMSKSIMLAIGFLLGYVCPLIIAVITVAVTAPGNEYIRADNACWLNWIQTHALLALVIPALTIVFINIIIVIVVLFKMLRRGVGDATQRDEKQTLVVIVRCLAILTPLFGLTWALGVGTMISSTNKGIHIAFAFFNSLQGFFILVFGTLFDSKVC
uniref:Adhesion G protein-coupled receptor F5 n=1 Tax=Sander lucioperca TaxID=283035 RepID=A0A8C9XAZ4_SANLU